MGDFFEGLRHSLIKKPLISVPRKIHDNRYQRKNRPLHSNYGNQNNTIQRPPLQNRSRDQVSMDEDVSSRLQDALENLCDRIETLTSNHAGLIDAQKKTIDKMERQAIAAEKIWDHFRQIHEAPKKI